MALVCFSGGLDSAVLAFDVAQHPYRYGVGSNEILHLLTIGTRKKKKLQPLVDCLRGYAQLEVQHHLHDCPLIEQDRSAIPEGGTQVASIPLAIDYRPDFDAMPHTPGLHMWLASVATNILAFDPDPLHGPRQAFFGFQFDGVTWNRYDKGELLPNDASPAFVDALNALVATAGDEVRFSAPFMDARMDKTMIAKLALDLGVPLQWTDSCIDGKACGVCVQCMRRHVVFRSLGITKE